MSEFMFVAKKVITQLALPPASLLVLAIVALLVSKRWPRASRAALWFSLVSLLALATPAVSRMLTSAISVPPASAQEFARAQAIVLLAGGKVTAYEIGPVPSQPSYDRLRYAAKLVRTTHLPLLVSGGEVEAPPPEAKLIAAVLREQFQIEPRWIEDRSRDTHENALFSAAILKQANIHTVALVTSGIHERRALAEFRAAGLVAIPMPSSVPSETGPTWLPQRLPGAQPLQASADAIREMLGAVFATPSS
jgi:uncharacterized SAM-binding protein YcdF (DUF218 family)